MRSLILVTGLLLVASIANSASDDVSANADSIHDAVPETVVAGTGMVPSAPLGAEWKTLIDRHRLRDVARAARRDIPNCSTRKFRRQYIRCR